MLVPVKKTPPKVGQFVVGLVDHRQVVLPPVAAAVELVMARPCSEVIPLSTWFLTVGKGLPSLL